MAAQMCSETRATTQSPLRGPPSYVQNCASDSHS
jgi:hypothetical protein